MDKRSGDSQSFDENWRNTVEASYLHWTRSTPVNQIQLAFRNHWHTFQELVGTEFEGRRVLEVGCGRGSLSAYFSDAGWETTLLDLSPRAIELARQAFESNSLKAEYFVGDCLALPFQDGQFDLVFSIGLLEHFEDISTVIDEQVRILDTGGVFIGYVVPELPNNIQADYSWINDILKTFVPKEEMPTKSEIYRSDVLSPKYLEVLKQNGLHSIGSSGIYSLPMISHSIDFPFSLMSESAEQILTDHFNGELDARRDKFDGRDPWLCEEGYGQAFLIWGTKK
jgi:ubiquinone/menaquinone biosynthesis C-methylase UbiE